MEAQEAGVNILLEHMRVIVLVISFSISEHQSRYQNTMAITASLLMWQLVHGEW
jgi:hypothetical protein